MVIDVIVMVPLTVSSDACFMVAGLLADFTGQQKECIAYFTKACSIAR